MTHHTNTVLAACAAFALTLSSIGAIVTVPPAHAETPAALDLPVIA